MNYSSSSKWTKLSYCPSNLLFILFIIKSLGKLLADPQKIPSTYMEIWKHNFIVMRQCLPAGPIFVGHFTLHICVCANDFVPENSVQKNIPKK